MRMQFGGLECVSVVELLWGKEGATYLIFQFYQFLVTVLVKMSFRSCLQGRSYDPIF